MVVTCSSTAIRVLCDRKQSPTGVHKEPARHDEARAESSDFRVPRRCGGEGGGDS